MKFLAMHKQDKTHEAGAPPDPAFVEEMGQFVGAMLQDGTFLDGAGVGKSANRTRVTFNNGVRTILDGPFAGSENELVHTVFKLLTPSRATAVDCASRIGEALGTCQLELAKTTESWDLGMEPEPPNAPWNALVFQKATPDTEAGKPASPATQAALTRVVKELREQGLLAGTVRLAPSSKGTRFQMDRSGGRRVVDGPFAESKELVGGFGMFELPSREAAVELCLRYGTLMLKSVETLEMDLRLVDQDA